MKKYLYIAIAAAALSSCSQDETLEMNQEAITFGEAFVDNATRAAVDPSYGSKKAIGSFKVWGTVNANDNSKVSLYTGDEVTNPSVTDGVYSNSSYGSAWTCNNVQYWIYGATYNFAAVVNGNIDNNSLVNGLPQTITYTADGTSDLLYAEQLNVVRQSSDTDKLVKFTFNHLLSKVKLTAQNTTGSNSKYTFTITNLSINTPASGTVTIGHDANNNNAITTTWSSTTSGTRAFTFNGEDSNADQINNTAVECDSEMLFIPYNYTETDQLTVSFSVNWYYDNKFIITETKSVSTTTELKAGNSYSFNIKYGLNTPIQFTVSTDPTWANGNNTDVTVQ